MFGAAYAFKKIYLQNGLQTTMYSTLSDEESESSVFISVYTILHDSSNCNSSLTIGPTWTTEVACNM
jgi:hypothetical protein